MRMVPLLLLMACALALPAQAGNVYRCDGGDGITTYSNKRVGGGKCKLVGSFKAARAAARSKRPWVAPYAPPPVAAGSANPPATVAGSPVAASLPPAKASFTAPRRVRGQVYSYVKDGVRTYTSNRPRGGAGLAGLRTIKYSYMEACFACGTKPGINFGKLRLNTSAYHSEISAAARQHGVDEAIVRAIIHAESAFNPNALSRVGAQGLMQLMPATARRFGVSNSFDATQNIGGGVKYLAWLLKRFNGNLTLAAAGYNAGEGAVDKYKGVPPYNETRRYVERVGVLADRYRGTSTASAASTGGLSAR